MGSATTTTFICRVESDAALLDAVARMYIESIADVPACRKAAGWREQVRHLVGAYGREVVIEALVEDVDGLTVRHAMILTDQAERGDSGRLVAAAT